MKAADPVAFARLMTDSHRSYAQDFEASTPAIDTLVADAVETGAYGARLTGGGFGGCIVALIESDAASVWIADFLARHPGTWQV